MISAMLFISPSAVRPAVSAATATATKAVTSAINALTKLFQCLKDAVRAIFGGSVFVADAVADAVAFSAEAAASGTATTTAPAAADCEDTITTDDESDVETDEESDDESDEEDSAAAVAAAPIPVKSLYRVLWAMATNATSHPVVRDDLQKPLATDTVALQYFTAIRDDPKYAALSPSDKDAAIVLVNYLHAKNDHRAFELDYDLALIDVVVGALRKCDWIVEKTYIVLLHAWWNGYLYLAWVLNVRRQDNEFPFPSARRTSLTTYFDRYPSPEMASDHFLTVFPSRFCIV
jgi:hypothetical protein